MGADELLPGTWEPIARILLRAEGVASSNIEGLRAPLESVVAAAIDDVPPRRAVGRRRADRHLG